jgi:mannose-1-phosphate guanylyltransferase
LELLDRGCVWNTFVMVGQARAFLDTIQSGAPDLYQAFEHIRTRPAGESCSETIERIYEGLKPADFSRLILSATPEKLGVLCLGDVGWNDLGDPQRLVDLVSRIGEESEWLTNWAQGAMHATAS